MIRQAIALILAIVAACSLGGCRSEEYRTDEGVIWNTIYHITYRSDRPLTDSIIAEMKRVEQSLSPFVKESLISKINRGESCDVDSLIARVFVTSQRINTLSHGAFDPTLAPLINLWGFGYDNSDGEPSQEQIDSALTLVGIDRCRIVDGKIIKADPKTQFNFSAITKGYGCDRVAEMLRRNGCEDFMVEIGGEIVASGHNPHGDSWQIMIDAPIANNAEIIHDRMAMVELSDCAIATSGNYRNYRDTPQGRVAHTISATTGRPVATTTLSATVIAPDCMTADALATACMAMPATEALEMIEGIDSVEALLVVDSEKGAPMILKTEGFVTK